MSDTVDLDQAFGVGGNLLLIFALVQVLLAIGDVSALNALIGSSWWQTALGGAGLHVGANL